MSRYYEKVDFDINGDDIRAFCQMHFDWTANVQFRIYTPFEALAMSGLGEAYPHKIGAAPYRSVDPVSMKMWQHNEEMGMRAMSVANVWMHPNAGSSSVDGANTAEQYIAFLEGVKKECLEKGRKPPINVYDAEDLNRYISPLSPAFRWLGTRDEQGNELKEGDEIWHTSPTTGVKRRLLKVGETKDFDLEGNKRRLKSTYDIARYCDLVVCTTQYLADYFKNEEGCENVFVYPNSVRPHCYPQVFLEKNPGEVRILWQGGNSHLADWEPIVNAVGRVLKRYPQAKFVFWGEPFGAVKRNILASQYEEYAWGGYEAFHARLACVNADINLCPIADNPFNLAKSAIKWYEPSMLAQPPATLASNVGPYREIKHGETGLLYNDAEEFEEHLSHLIESETTRQEMGAASKDWVLGHRHYLTTIAPYAEKLTEMLQAREAPLVEV